MKGLKIIGLLLIVLVSIILFRTGQFAAKPPSTTTQATPQTLALDTDKLLANFSQAIRFKTISSETSTEKYDDQFQAWQAFLRRTYPAVFQQLSVQTFGKQSLLLKWQGSDDSLQPVLLMAHQDVVPIAPGTEKDWQVEPFSGAIKDGYVWGRGSLDDKGSLISLLETTNLLLSQQFKPQRSMYFYFGADEEIGGASASETAQALKQQGVQFAFVIDEGGFVVTNLFKHIHQPVALISIAEKGYMNVNLSTQVKGGHSSMPSDDLAIATISEAIVKLRQHRPKPQFTGASLQLFETLGRYKSFTQRIMIANLWLFKPIVLQQLMQTPFTNALIRTTTAPTIFKAGVKSNVLPAYASAVINFRLAPGDSTQSILQHVKDTVDNPDITVTSDLKWEPSPLSDSKAWGYQLIEQTIQQHYSPSLIIAPWVVVGATDARHFIPVADNVYRFMPVTYDVTDLGRIHGINERIAVEQYLNGIRFYYDLLKKIAMQTSG